MSAKYKLLEKKGTTLIIQVSLEDGRGFILQVGEDRISEVEKLIKDHAKALFNIEVKKIVQAQ